MPPIKLFVFVVLKHTFMNTPLPPHPKDHTSKMQGSIKPNVGRMAEVLFCIIKVRLVYITLSEFKNNRVSN